MRLKSVAILSASMLALATAPAANATTFFFNLSSNGTATSGTNGNARLFSATTGSTTINARATAWSLNTSGVIQNAFLGSFSNGLGVTARSETGGNNTHTTDNYNGTDFIIFQFDKPVEFVSGKFTTYTLLNVPQNVVSNDSDASIDFGTTAAAWNSPLSLNNQGLGTLNSLLNGVGFEATGGSAPNGVVRDLQPGAAGQKVGNLWMVASSFINQGGDKKYDAFKFDDLTVSYIDPLPEPGSWALMLCGFGMVGFALRRRRTVATA